MIAFLFSAWYIFLGLLIPVFIAWAIWRLLPENRENRGEFWVYGNEYRVRGTTAPISLAISSDWIEDLDQLGLLPVDDNEFIISASRPEDIEDVEERINQGKLILIERKERNYKV